jgi:hypothetical protein
MSVVVLACRVAAFDHSLALMVVEKVMQPPFSGSHSDLVNLARPFKACHYPNFCTLGYALSAPTGRK